MLRNVGVTQALHREKAYSDLRFRKVTAALSLQVPSWRPLLKGIFYLQVVHIRRIPWFRVYFVGNASSSALKSVVKK